MAFASMRAQGRQLRFKLDSTRFDRTPQLVLAVALGVGLLVRVAVLTQTESLRTPIVDEQHYAQLAFNLTEGHGLAWAAGQPTSLRPPLYPAFIASIWTMAGVGNLQAIRLVQIALALLTTGLVYLVGRRTHDETVGSYAAAAFWLYPSLIFSNFTILTETLFTFLLVGFVLLAIMVSQTPRVLTAVCCGVLLGLAALTRSVMWPVPLILCPLLFAIVRAPTRRRLLIPLAVLAGYAMVVAPWAVRNTKLQGVLTIVDTMGGQNLRMGNFEHTPDDRMWAAISLTGEKHWAHALRKERPNERLTEGQKDKWAQAKALAYMRDHPAETFRRSLIRFADFWGLEREYIAAINEGLYRPPTWFAITSSAAILFGYLLLVTTAAAGMWLAPPDTRSHVLLLVPVLVIMGIHTVVFGHSRYHLPLIPILAVYAAAVVSKRHEYTWARHRTMMLTAGATVCVLLVIWARQILIVDAARLARLFNHG